MDKMDVNLREYLQQNHNQLTWKERIHIIYNIIQSLDRIVTGTISSFPLLRHQLMRIPSVSAHYKNKLVNK